MSSALYGQLNGQFFRGRLPADAVRFRRFDVHGKEGECSPESRTILLATGLKRDPERLRQVLLHEICHIGAPDHGRRFQAKLAKLAAAGESWAEQERRQLAERPRGWSVTQEIAQAIGDAALDNPDARWSSAVLRMLANYIGRSPRETLRIAPWAPRRWERVRSEARAPRDPRRHHVEGIQRQRGR